MHSITSSRASHILSQCNGKTIAVIGDIMLDRYFWGSVNRISPEAPVPVIDLEHESIHLGGAANVAGNLQALGINPLLCGVIGDDNTGAMLIDILESTGCSSAGMIRLAHRPTTVKTRIIGNNQQMLRVDREIREAITDAEADMLLGSIMNTPNLAGIILEDYNKGVMTKTLIQSLCSLAQARNIPVFVDPKFNHFFEYKGVAVFKPNRKEAQEALGFSLSTKEDIQKAGNELLHKLECENVLLTLGEQGMMLFEKNGAISSVPTRARKVSDVSGAGDTTIAMLAAAIAGGASVQEAAAMSNYAAGIVCEQPGIVTVMPEEVIHAIDIDTE
ncbi:MAG: D-glycero-beta-D-manno-heptose-7-phosphate kinase [Bacteroidota bacterium]